MRATLWMICAMAVVMACLAGASDQLCRNSAQTFSREGEYLRDLLEKKDWQNLRQAVEQVTQRWNEREAALQLLIRHQETDDVSEALNKLLAGADAQNDPLCRWALAEFNASCRRLYDRDALTLTNLI